MLHKPEIILAADHAGLKLKERLIGYLSELGYTVTDKGAFGYDADDDYPDIMTEAALAVVEDPLHRRGIFLGGSGQGEAVCANRIRGIRAAVYYGGSEEVVKLSREHNDANVLALGARFLTLEEAERVARLWLETSFPGEERHVRRINKIDS